MSPNDSPVASPRRRWPFVVVLLASLAWIGLLTGTSAGAAWFVPKGSGLAGPVIVLGYGVLGAGIGLLLGAVLATKASHGILRTAAALALVIGLFGAGFTVWRATTLRSERMAAAGMDVPLPRPAEFRIESRIAEVDGMRRYREMTVDARDWTANWVAVGPEAAPCKAELIADEANALLRKRGELREIHDRSESLCPVSEPSATHVYTFRESGTDALSWNVLGDLACLQTSADFADLYFVLGRITTDAVSHGRARCEL